MGYLIIRVTFTEIALVMYQMCDVIKSGREISE